VSEKAKEEKWSRSASTGRRDQSEWPFHFKLLGFVRPGFISPCLGMIESRECCGLIICIGRYSFLQT